MRAEILSIGTELLLGQIVDTNAVYLAQRLAEVGVALHFKDTVGDNADRLADTLRLARGRAEVILCTVASARPRMTSPPPSSRRFSRRRLNYTRRHRRTWRATSHGWDARWAPTSLSKRICRAAPG